MAMENVPRGPPERLDTTVPRTTYDLLDLAKVPKGSCIQCGYEGHYMHQDKCALRDKPLVDRPCVKCGKGLHSADDCLRVFQRQFVAPGQPNQNPEEAKDLK